MTRFNKAATTYDLYSTVQTELFNALFTQLQTAKQETDTFTLIDLGCGTGKNTLALKKYFKNATIQGIDHAPHMIDYAQHHYAHPDITYTHLSIDEVLTQTQADVIFSNASFQWLPNPSKTFELLKQKNPKLILFSVFVPPTYTELKQCLSTTLKTPVTLPVDHFLTYPDWNTLTHTMGRSVTASQLQITVPYANSFELLRQMSKTGTSKSFPIKKIWTPSFLKQLDAIFLETYGMVKSTFHMAQFLIQ